LYKTRLALDKILHVILHDRIEHVYKNGLSQS